MPTVKQPIGLTEMVNHDGTCDRRHEHDKTETSGIVIWKSRWIVEKTFAWLGNFCRLIRAVQETAQSPEA